MNRLHALVLTLLLVGCGGQETTEIVSAPAGEGASARQQTEQFDSRPVIVAFGDSITAGHGVDAGQSYPDLLQMRLDHLGYRYRVVNAGISGDTTTRGLARLRDVIDQNPVLVIVELGGNDGLRGLPLSATEANLEQIIVKLQEADMQIVLAGMTLPPNYGPAYVRGFEKIYTDLSKQYDLPMIPFRLEEFAGMPDLMQEDGIHPAEKGHQKIADAAMQALEPLLGKPQQSFQ